MTQNAKWQRVETALSGAKPDQVPFAFWMHFPEIDREADKLAQATIDLHRQYDMDYVKVMFRSSFAVEDWGARAEQYHPERGSWQISQKVIHTPQDWYKLKALSPSEGVLGEQLYILRQINQELAGDAPILATVFAPTMIAAYLADQATLLEHLESDPQAVQAGLEVISQTVVNFGKACLENGANGLFYAVQAANHGLPSAQTYRQVGQNYDRAALQDLYGRTNFTMLHIHGEAWLFDELVDYPAHVLNWFDRGSGPALKEARTRTTKPLAGGIDHEQTLMKGTPQEIAAEVQDAVQQVNGQGFLLAPGCVVPITVPQEKLQALKAAVTSRS
jgi:uroporphyrinogen decarboxylase